MPTVVAGDERTGRGGAPPVLVVVIADPIRDP